MLSSAFITVFRTYNPFLYIGTILATAGAGLLTTLTVTTPSAQWIGYQFLAAFGAGICRQIAFTAVPLAFPGEDLALTSAIVAWCNSLGPTLGIAISQAVFTNELTRLLNGVAGVDISKILYAGPVGLPTVVSGEVLEIVKQAFNQALRGAFIVAIPVAGAAFLASCGIPWARTEKH